MSHLAAVTVPNPCVLNYIPIYKIPHIGIVIQFIYFIHQTRLTNRRPYELIKKTIFVQYVRVRVYIPKLRIAQNTQNAGKNDEKTTSNCI